MASKWKQIGWGLAAFLTISGTIVGVFFYSTGQIGSYDLLKQSREFDAVFAESKRLGLPMTAAEVDQRQAVPDEENAALIVMPAISRLEFTPNLSDHFLPGADAKKRAEAEAALKVHKKMFAIVLEGLKRPRWYTPRDWDLGPNLVFPEYAPMKSAIRLLAAESVHLAEQGKVKEALIMFKAGRNLANIAGSEAYFFSILVSISADGAMIKCAEQITELWSEKPDWLDQLLRAIAESNFELDIRRAWRGEYYTTLVFCRNFEEFGGKTALERGHIMDFPASSLRKDGAPTSITARAIMTPMSKSWNAIFRRWPDGQLAPLEWFPLMRSTFDASVAEGTQTHHLAEIFFPAVENLGISLARRPLLWEMTVAMIRVVQQKHRTGSYPKSLTEVGSVIPDTLGGSDSVQYKVADGVVQIYSIGTDQVDIGGPLELFPMMTGKSDPGVVYPSSRRAVAAAKNN